MNTNQLDAVFSALADSTRRAMLARLAQGEASVSELAEPFAISQPAVSRHLKVLEQAGLVVKGRDAQRRPCRLDIEVMGAAQKWIETYQQAWEANFGRMDALLDELKALPTTSTGDK